MGAIGVALLGLLALTLAGISATRLRRMLHAWWSPAPAPQTDSDLGGDPPTMSFSLIVVARGNEDAFGRTLENLAAFDHPDVEILGVVGHNEPRARELAAAAAYRHPHRIRVVVDRGFRRSEPRALNAGLAECRGDVVGVFRPGDEVRPGILRHVEATLAMTGADVVQSGVLLTAEQPSWFSIRRMVESYFWFRSCLHYYAQQRFTPLVTSSMFVRADVLRDAGGWDEDAVAEGCELGVRLSVAGVPVAVTWDPEVVTRAAVAQSIAGVVAPADALDPGLPSGPARGRLAAASEPQAAGARQGHAGDAVPRSRHRCGDRGAGGRGGGGRRPCADRAGRLPALDPGGDDRRRGDGRGRGAPQHRGCANGRRDQLLLLLGAIPYQFLLATAALRALIGERRSRRSRDTGPHASGRSVDAEADADADTDTVPTERPQLVRRATGRRGRIHDVETRAGAVDR